MYETEDEVEFGSLLRFLQINDFRVWLVEGQRGVGKSTFTKRLLDRTNALYYKTWGKDQKTNRFAISELGLELPQATYFVLDFLSQVKLGKAVVCDRASMSALAYQQEEYLGRGDIHRYYVDLMHRSGSVLLLLEQDEDEILRRRINRGEDDEQRLYRLPASHAERYVRKDGMDYRLALDTMEKAGLKCGVTYELDGAVCNCFVPSDTQLITPEETGVI